MLQERFVGVVYLTLVRLGQENEVVLMAGPSRLQKTARWHSIICNKTVFNQQSGLNLIGFIMRKTIRYHEWAVFIRMLETFPFDLGLVRDTTLSTTVYFTFPAYKTRCESRTTTHLL